jgi:hypothetical protein
MRLFLHRSRYISFAIAYIMIYTQIFGVFQGNNPIDLKKVVSEIQWSEIFISSAYARPADQQDYQDKIKELNDVLVRIVKVNLTAKKNDKNYQFVNLSDDKKTCGVYVQLKNTNIQGVKALCIDGVINPPIQRDVINDGFYLNVVMARRILDFINENDNEKRTGIKGRVDWTIADNYTQLVDEATAPRPLPPPSEDKAPAEVTSQEQEVDELTPLVEAVLGDEEFDELLGLVEEAPAAAPPAAAAEEVANAPPVEPVVVPIPVGPQIGYGISAALKASADADVADQKFRSGIVGQESTAVVKPSDPSDTTLRSQVAQGAGRTVTIDLEDGSQSITSERVPSFSAVLDEGQQEQLTDVDKKINRTYVSNEEAAKFVEAVTLAYQNANRFIYGTSLISSVNYLPVNNENPNGVYQQGLSWMTNKPGDSSQGNDLAVMPFVKTTEGRFTLNEYYRGVDDQNKKELFSTVSKYFFPDRADPYSPILEFAPPEMISGENNEKSYYGVELCSAGHANQYERSESLKIERDLTYLVLKPQPDSFGCESLKRDNQLPDKGRNRGDIYLLENEFSCSKIIDISKAEGTPDRTLSSSCEGGAPADGNILTVSVKPDSASSDTMKISSLTCGKAEGSTSKACKVPSLLGVAAGDNGIDLISSSAEVARPLCSEEHMPYEMIFGGFDLGYGADDAIEPGHDYFFWVQMQYPQREYDDNRWIFPDVGVPQGQRRDPCQANAEKKPDKFRIVGVSKDSVNFVAKVVPGEFQPYTKINLEAALRQVDTRGLTFEYRDHESEDASKFLGSGQAELKAYMERTITDSNYMNLLWQHSGLRAHEIAMLYSYAKNKGMLTQVRGILPVGFKEAGRFTYPENKFPFGMNFNLTEYWNPAKTPFTLLNGPMFWIHPRAERNEFDKNYFAGRELAGWLVGGYAPLGMLPKVKRGDKELEWGYGVPNVGSWLEFASLAAMNADKDTLLINTRHPKYMRDHARRMAALMPAFKIYKTQFQGGANAIEVALRDRKDISKASPKNDDFIDLGLVKPGDTKEIGFTLNPVDLAGRGMLQTWRVTRPAGFPAGQEDMNTHLSERLNDVKGHQLGEDKNQDVDSSYYRDEVKNAVKEYDKLAKLYTNTRNTGDSQKERPLASAKAEEMAAEDFGSKTFLEQTLQFEQGVYKGMPMFRGNKTVDSGKFSGALRQMGQAMSDGENIWLLYLQNPSGATEEGNSDDLDKGITHRIYIEQLSKANPLALQDKLKMDPGAPYPLIIPAIYSPLLTTALSNLNPQNDGHLEVNGFSNFISGKVMGLHYHDVLWVHENPEGHGEAFTGADLVAAATRFNMLLMYLMTFMCLNDQVFSDVIKGLKDQIDAGSTSYKDTLVGGPTAQAAAPGSSPIPPENEERNKVMKALAGMVSMIEKNKELVMDQCWVTPFYPLRAFRFEGKKNVDQVGQELVTQMGLNDDFKKLFDGYGGGLSVDNRVGGVIDAAAEGPKKAKPGECSWTEWAAGAFTFDYGSKAKCNAGWQVGQAMLLVVVVAAIIGLIALIHNATKGKGSGPAASSGPTNTLQNQQTAPVYQQQRAAGTL